MNNEEKKSPLDILSEVSGLDKEKISDIEDSFNEIKNNTTSFVQNNPLVSIAIAAGIGYIIAKALTGRRS